MLSLMTAIRVVLMALTAAALCPATAPKQVLTFYYGWYGNPATSGRWVHWRDVDETARNIGQSTHFPRLGAYDSHDPKIVEQHCRWAKEAGITGFIMTWWRQGDFHDQGMPLMLDTARKQGLSITAYFETVREGGPLADVLYVLEKYGQHPAWLKVDGRPVLFVYGRAVGQLKLEGWKPVTEEAKKKLPNGAVFIGDRISEEAAKIFDGVHTYNITGRTKGMSVEQIRAWGRATFPEWVKTAGGGISCLTIIPGYDDTELDRPKPRPTTDRHGGETYRTLWREAIAANPDWVLITSFNEWHEGSEIEPSVEDGDRELETTRRFAPQFLKGRASR